MNKKLVSSLIGGGVTITLASLGGVELSNKIDYDKKVEHYGKLSSYFSKNAPKTIKDGFYMPRWEEDKIWKKIHNKAGGIIIGKQGSFKTYQKMRDACYGLINEDKKFNNCESAAENWCSSCTWGNDWSKD